jgi:uncharacterized membrane protein
MLEIMLMSVPGASDAETRTRVADVLDRALLGLARHWLILLSLALAIFVGLPWLAPVFMELGWPRAAHAIYLVYATQCHQLPQRSFFLFGNKAMYSLTEIQAAWQVTTSPLVLRQFIGNAQMGWKVAWSDRMVTMYTSILFLSILYWPFRRWIRPLPLWSLAILALPIFIDVGTHMISDLSGIGQGFRDTNAWLAILTHNSFPADFYAGDMLGSFNSWARLITGTLLGLGIVGWLYPHLNRILADLAREIDARLQGTG